MESKKVESNAELTPFEKEFKVQLNLPAAYFSVFYVIYVRSEEHTSELQSRE